MKKVLVMAALVLGTTAMVNAQDKTTQAAPAKEVKHAKHAKKEAEKAAKVADVKKVEAEKAATTVKMETKKAMKK